MNAEAIGETDERAGHSQLVRAAATAEVQEVYTRANSPLYGFYRLAAVRPVDSRFTT